MRFERTPGQEPVPPGRRRPALTLALFAFASALVVQSPGWAQTSYMALSKALSHGTAQIDPWHWEPHDVGYTDGHYYSVKPPGLVLATLPLYRALDVAGADRRPSSPSLRYLALAGLLAGLAVLCEYPLAIAAGIVGPSRCARRRTRGLRPPRRRGSCRAHARAATHR